MLFYIESLVKKSFLKTQQFTFIVNYLNEYYLFDKFHANIYF